MVKALAKAAGAGANDEAAAHLADAIAADVMGTASVYEHGDEDDFLAEVHLLGVEPRDPAGKLKREVSAGTTRVRWLLPSWVAGLGPGNEGGGQRGGGGGGSGGGGGVGGPATSLPAQLPHPCTNANLVDPPLHAQLPR